VPATAHGTMDLLLLRGREGRWTVAASARYHDRYVRDGATWRFAERIMELYSPEP
jgi:SnoaL-like domain